MNVKPGVHYKVYIRVAFTCYKDLKFNITISSTTTKI